MRFKFGQWPEAARAMRMVVVRSAIALTMVFTILSITAPLSSADAQSSYASPTRANSSSGADIPLFQDLRPLPDDAVSREALVRDLKRQKARIPNWKASFMLHLTAKR